MNNVASVEIQNPSFFKKMDEVSSFAHSKELDKFFGFKIPKIEQKLLKNYRPFYKSEDESNRKNHFQNTQTWIGLHPQYLQTPYSQLVQILSLLKDYPIKTVTDFGAGYGRIALVLKSIFESCHFTGYEIIKERADEAIRIWEKWNITDAEMHLQNILDDHFTPPTSDLYFIYDFSTREDIHHLLNKIESVKINNFLIICKGERSNSVLQMKGHKVIHSQKSWSIYQIGNVLH